MEINIDFDVLRNRIYAMRLALEPETGVTVAPPSPAAELLDGAESIIDWCEFDAAETSNILAMRNSASLPVRS